MSADEHLSQHQFGDLEGHLLSMGGDTAHVDRNDPDSDDIMGRGQTWEGRGAEFKRGKPVNCHRNAADLHLDSGHDIATGYALSKTKYGDAWMQHSWGVNRDTGKPIETTTRRVKYHGVLLQPHEAEKFARVELGDLRVDRSATYRGKR